MSVEDLNLSGELNLESAKILAIQQVEAISESLRLATTNLYEQGSRLGEGQLDEGKKEAIRNFKNLMGNIIEDFERIEKKLIEEIRKSSIINEINNYIKEFREECEKIKKRLEDIGKKYSLDLT